jgi:hypothetical protein
MFLTTENIKKHKNLGSDFFLKLISNFHLKKIMESMNKKNYQSNSNSNEAKNFVALKHEAKSSQTDADETFANHKFVGIFYLLERKKSSILTTNEGDLKP